MNPLSGNEIESELSYAYLHAVASMAGVSCKHVTRHEDNNGIDAQLTAWGPFPNGGYLNEIDLKIQLKAKKGIPIEKDGHLSYFLQDEDSKRYNDLRADTVSIHRILVVLFLPDIKGDWLGITEEELILKNSAFWVSLRGAGPSSNKTGQTVYLPKTQIFHPENLMSIFARLSRNEVLNYHISELQHSTY
jgi:hypothetical protein